MTMGLLHRSIERFPRVWFPAPQPLQARGKLGRDVGSLPFREAMAQLLEDGKDHGGGPLPIAPQRFGDFLYEAVFLHEG